jgi:endogenous inhibitor of DNA gyrase (YacG/DUF329 family)
MVQNDSDVVTGNCPTCGMPVAAEAGVTSGTCPYCGEAIPAQPASTFDPNNLDPSKSVRIL